MKNAINSKIKFRDFPKILNCEVGDFSRKSDS